MRDILRLSWRVFYPVILYAILLSAAAEFGNGSLLFTGAAAAVAGVIFVPVYWNDKRRRLSETDEKHNVDYLSLVCMGGGFCLVSNLSIIWTGITSEAYRQAEAVLFAPDIWLQILLIGFFIPITEELIFRGLCFGRLREQMGFWAAAVLTSLLFGWFHGNIVQGIYAFFGGLLMAWGYEQFHSLKAAYSVHAGSNLFSLWISSGSLGIFLGNNKAIQVVGFLIGMLFLLIGVFRIKKKRKVV